MNVNADLRVVDDDGVAHWVRQVDHKPRVSAMLYLYDIAEGNITDHSGWSKMGFNSDVQTAEEIVSPQGGTYVFPTTGQHMHVVSSSVEDDPDKGAAVAGTGVFTLTIYYLDSNWAEKSETVTLNGQVAVETSATDIYRIQNVRVVTAGTGLRAAGNISIKNHAETITYGYVATGNTRQRQFVWTVPAGKVLYMTQANVYCIHTAANKVATITLKAGYDDKLGARTTTGIMIPHAEAILADTPIAATYTMPKKFPEKVDIVVVGKSTGTASMAIVMAGWIENV